MIRSWMLGALIGVALCDSVLGQEMSDADRLEALLDGNQRQHERFEFLYSRMRLTVAWVELWNSWK